MPLEFISAREEMRHSYPMGADVILTGTDRIIGIPRTTALETLR
jgi:alpha-D-ribose 1-methylphosphonate 5-triphosphate synthase subunit PhnH